MMAGCYALPVTVDQGSANSILFRSSDQGREFKKKSYHRMISKSRGTKLGEFGDAVI